MKPLTLVVALIGAFVVSANAADTFKIDSVHSFVLFSVQHNEAQLMVFRRAA